MTNKKLTDEEIISSLQVIATTCNCNECKIRSGKWGTCNCSETTANAALDLINRQKVEVERLQKEANLVSIQFQDVQERVEEYRLKIENLQNVISNQQIEISVKIEKQIKSEAYKEFAKEVKEEIKKAYDNNLDVFREHLEKHKDNPNFEFLSTITGKTDTLRGLDYFIDNLLKEMTGEEEK